MADPESFSEVHGGSERWLETRTEMPFLDTATTIYRAPSRNPTALYTIDNEQSKHIKGKAH